MLYCVSWLQPTKTPLKMSAAAKIIFFIVFLNRVPVYSSLSAASVRAQDKPAEKAESGSVRFRLGHYIAIDESTLICVCFAILSR
jgi:hypothetical protein